MTNATETDISFQAYAAVLEYRDHNGELPDAGTLIIAYDYAQKVNDLRALSACQRCWNQHINLKG